MGRSAGEDFTRGLHVTNRYRVGSRTVASWFGHWPGQRNPDMPRIMFATGPCDRHENSYRYRRSSNSWRFFVAEEMILKYLRKQI